MEQRDDTETQPYTPVQARPRPDTGRIPPSAPRQGVEWEWQPAQRPGAPHNREQMEGRLRKAMFGGLALGGLLVVLRVVSLIFGGGQSPEASPAPTPATLQTPLAATSDVLGAPTVVAAPVAQSTPQVTAVGGAQVTGPAQLRSEATAQRSGSLTTQNGNPTPALVTPAAQVRSPETAGFAPGVATTPGAAPASGRATPAPGSPPLATVPATAGSAGSLSGTGSAGTTSLGGTTITGPSGNSNSGTTGGSSSSLGVPGTSALNPGGAGASTSSRGSGAVPGALGVTATPGAAAATRATAVPSSSSASGRTYTIKSGDTLYAIALRYNTTVEALVTANSLRSPETILAIGQKLVLP